jgi:SAM-dependent methyltransferase
MNNFLEFYKEHQISPVSQNIDEISIHFNRRIGLYRTLGLTHLHFRDRDILEVGPGSGHNSIVTAIFGPKSYDLVEPNPTGYNQMLNLFGERQLKSNNIQFLNTQLEHLPNEKAYDVVLCEGLIPGLSNQDIFLKRLTNKVRSGGILVVTCVDAISAFFELLRRYLAYILVFQSGIGKDVNQIVGLLTEVFKPHLASLKGMSRSVEDWVWDNLLNPATASAAGTNEFSIEKCFDVFGDNFYFYGSNPSFMDNWTWYKNLPISPRDFNEPYRKSFKMQRHNLFNYLETVENSDAGEELYYYCRAFALHLEKMKPLDLGPMTLEDSHRDLKPVGEVLRIVSKLGLKNSALAIAEFMCLFNEGKLPDRETVSRMRFFPSAFGRGQQYVSLIRASN